MATVEIEAREEVSKSLKVKLGQITYSPKELRYLINGRPVIPAVVKGAAEVALTNTEANISLLVERLQAGDISLKEFYAAMKRETKMLHGTQTALARGGFENMRPSDWQRASAIVEQQWGGDPDKFPGLRAFVEDITKGRYGPNADSSAVNQRAGMYADAGRSTFENERTEVHKEKGFTEAARFAAEVDHCPTCVAENGEWRPIDDVVPIGQSECGARCWCVIIYR